VEGDQAAEEALLLGTPPAAIGLQDDRVAGDQLRQPASVAVVVGEAKVGQPLQRAHADPSAGRAMRYAPA
jgi:hypothetical protein